MKGEGDERKGGKETLRGIDRCERTRGMCLPVSVTVTVKELSERRCRHSQNPLINSSSVIGFLTAVDDPSWKLTHTMPSSCCPLPLSAGRPSLDSGRVSSIILPKKSRFTFGAFAFFPSSTAAGDSSSKPESMAPPARYLACRASAFWRSRYF